MKAKETFAQRSLATLCRTANRSFVYINSITLHCFAFGTIFTFCCRFLPPLFTACSECFARRSEWLTKSTVALHRPALERSISSATNSEIEGWSLKRNEWNGFELMGGFHSLIDSISKCVCVDIAMRSERADKEPIACSQHTRLLSFEILHFDRVNANAARLNREFQAFEHSYRKCFRSKCYAFGRISKVGKSEDRREKCQPRWRGEIRSEKCSAFIMFIASLNFLSLALAARFHAPQTRSICRFHIWRWSAATV